MDLQAEFAALIASHPQSQKCTGKPATDDARAAAMAYKTAWRALLARCPREQQPQLRRMAKKHRKAVQRRPRATQRKPKATPSVSEPTATVASSAVAADAPREHEAAPHQRIPWAQAVLRMAQRVGVRLHRPTLLAVAQCIRGGAVKFALLVPDVRRTHPWLATPCCHAALRALEPGQTAPEMGAAVGVAGRLVFSARLSKSFGFFCLLPEPSARRLAAADHGRGHRRRGGAGEAESTASWMDCIVRTRDGLRRLVCARGA